MRREQVAELVNLTTHLPAQRPTAEMPAVDLVDLLRRDRELDEPPPPAVPVVTAERFDTSCRYHAAQPDEPSPGSELAAGTMRITRPSRVKLVLGCLAAFVGGFGMTLPLWW